MVLEASLPSGCRQNGASTEEGKAERLGKVQSGEEEVQILLKYVFEMLLLREGQQRIGLTTTGLNYGQKGTSWI